METDRGTADLIFHDSILDLIHEIRYNPGIHFVSRAICSFDATQYRSKLALDPIEGTRQESAKH